ncbi:hypothetical protein GCM10009808_14590 [Microbacterium sediminicola]|uniref:Uncharacterized protein n=1 Tax=Microbacterium sediminicola TaxID=415210 RepID=A0ABP4U410_9MICO
MELTAAQRATFASIIDTFMPGDGGAIPPASAFGAPVVAEGILMSNPRSSEIEMFTKIMNLWDTRLGGMFIGVGPTHFSELSHEQREAALVAMSDSRMPLKRVLFQNLKAAATLSS